MNLFTGPPCDKKDDEKVVRDLMDGEARTIVCGGTSATIVSRVLNRKMTTSLHYSDPDIPPVGRIEGLDLVTEGVLTLSRTLHLLKRYVRGDVDEAFFMELDKENGGSMVAKMIIEQCTDLHLMVGRAINVAHQNPNLPFDLSIRMNLMEQMKEVVAKIGKQVTITFY